MRLFVLQVGERGPGLLVREIDADASGRQQRAGDQREDQQQILAEKSAAVRMLRGRARGFRARGGEHWFRVLDACAGLDGGCRHWGPRAQQEREWTRRTLRVWFSRVKDRPGEQAKNAARRRPG